MGLLKNIVRSLGAAALLSLAFAASQHVAAQPANDSCSAPVLLMKDVPVNGTTALASNDYQLSGAACFTGVGQTSSAAPGRDVVYAFTAPAAGNYSFKVTNYSASNDMVLYLANSCPVGVAPVTVACSVAGNRNSNSSSEELMCVPLAASQQVFVFVDENSFTGGSGFSIEVNPCIQESEPNDTPATASTPAFGIEGSIAPAGEVDFYSLGTPAAGSRVFAMVDGVAGSSTDFDMRITTTTDTLEYDDTNNDALFGALSPNIAGRALTGVASFIRINHFSGGTQSEPYRLYHVVQPPLATATLEAEPNDTLAQANSAANNYFSGFLAGPAPSADVDTYSFAAAAGDLLFLSLDSDPLRNGTPINATLALLDSAGMTLLSVNDSGSIFSTMSGAGSLAAGSPHSPAEALVYRVSTGGTFYAKVSIGTSSTGPTGLGDYLLSISKNGAIGAGGAPVLDIDLDGAYDALTDGLLVIRYLFGLTGTGLTNGATAPGAKRIDPGEIATYLASIDSLLDVDDNTQTDALTDGLIILRYLFGLRGSALIHDAIGQDANRTGEMQVEAYIRSLTP